MGTEELWAGEFGDEYTERNSGVVGLLRAKETMLRRALAVAGGQAPGRVIEFGANIGLNLTALRRISPWQMCSFSAVEVNETACTKLAGISDTQVFLGSMLDPKRPWGAGYDLAMSIGVLIHIHPDDLPAAYEALYAASDHYILTAEYHNPTPVEVPYRGELGRLWKRDFAAEMLDRFGRLSVADYGFAWRRDPYNPGIDDLVWTLLHKRK